ncbi:outer membrane beta-barrel protein [Limnoglobus roseus]|uniref:Porin n=1 Tax=Limnoglobus roseus TaxID=2598579 RepID=A0A5C1A9D8_9BACT|nr:outer membrane beta-barrel protein [Limnoglobus roseus]QEL15979.1 hypothetical protein PX52LOC_02916 [Limnoglobus roseus]
MITTMLLGTWLAAGQAPAPMPMPMAPKALPMAVPMAVPMTAPAAAPPAAPAPMAVGTPVAAPAPEAPTAEEPPKEDTKYFVEKLLAGSAFGQRLADNGVKINGWAGMSYTGSTTSRTNLPITFNDQANSFQLNQVWLNVTKGIDTSKKEVQFGYNIATFYGTDYRFTIPRGFLQYQVEDQRNYGFDVVYHYAEIFLPNLGGEGTTLRAGRWGTGIGYEVIDTVNTPFLTKSYNFQYNPFTHTGVQANTQINENLSMYNGAVTGSDVYIDPAARLTYVGGIKYAPKDGKGFISFNTVIGPGRYLGKENFVHFNSFNVTGSYNLTDKLTYVLDATFSYADKFPAGFGNVQDPGTSADWYGFANYFLYKVNDKLSSNFRVELFNDTKGVRTGFEGLYTEMTYGLTYTPKDWMILRPFVRYDYNSRSTPFEGDHHLVTGGIEAILRY